MNYRGYQIILSTEPLDKNHPKRKQWIEAAIANEKQQIDNILDKPIEFRAIPEAGLTKEFFDRSP